MSQKKANRLFNFGCILVAISLVTYVLAFIFGIFSEQFPKYGFMLIPYGDTPLAIFVHSFIAACMITAVSIFRVSDALDELRNSIQNKTDTHKSEKNSEDGFEPIL